jgi:hypothetical protein
MPQGPDREAHPPQTAYYYTPDIQGYQQAVWDFLMEHSELLPSGSLFIKFGASSRQNFENRVLSRWKFNYHREDPQQKYAGAQAIRERIAAEKAEARGRYEARKEASKKRYRRRVFFRKLFTAIGLGRLWKTQKSP